MNAWFKKTHYSERDNCVIVVVVGSGGGVRAIQMKYVPHVTKIILQQGRARMLEHLVTFVSDASLRGNLGPIPILFSVTDL